MAELVESELTQCASLSGLQGQPAAYLSLLFTLDQSSCLWLGVHHPHCVLEDMTASKEEISRSFLLLHKGLSIRTCHLMYLDTKSSGGEMAPTAVVICSSPGAGCSEKAPTSPVCPHPAF